MTATNARAKIEFGLNILIAVAILAIAVVVVRRTFFPEQVNGPNIEQRAQMLLGTGDARKAGLTTLKTGLKQPLAWRRDAFQTQVDCCLSPVVRLVFDPFGQ